jgi:membrane-associated phospholipid phosphatase
VTALVVTIVLALAAGPARRLAAVCGGLLIAGVGVSLVIDGVHYPSDVLASILWGIAIAPLARMLWVSVVLARRI